MILTCPSCATSYFTPDEAIGASGRRVRCRTCDHIWHATLVEEPLELSEPPEAAAALAPQAGSGPGFGKREEAPESLAETPAPELPKAFRARAEEQRRVRRAATHGAVWAGLASVFVAILGAAWLFRVEVVDLYPRAAAAYAMVGSPVNATGLNFEAMTIKVAPYDPGKVIVSGAIRNIRDREIVSPAVRVALLDAHGAEIGFRIIPIDTAPVLPGGVQGFAAVVPDPGQKIVGIGVDFVAEARSKPSAKHDEPAHGDTAHGDDGHAAPEHPAEDHAAPDHAAQPAADHVPAERPLPVADSHSELRPAISRDPALPVMTPIDARPIAETHPAPAAHH
ncbi:zinc-ribbon domain-containing protein [soil metagenome]